MLSDVIFHKSTSGFGFSDDTRLRMTKFLFTNQISMIYLKIHS